MMGSKSPTSKLFYQFSLEEQVPPEHLLRRVAAAVDFSFVRRLTERFYSHTGQPSVDPIVIFKMALVGYLYGITSERRLVEEIRLNLAYRWFIGYDLDEPVPDHSVLSKARARYGLTVYLGFFKEIVRQCEQAGLVKGNKLYLDSTLVQANADVESFGSRALISQLSDVGEHVRKLWQDNPDTPPSGEHSRCDEPTLASGASDKVVRLPVASAAALAVESGGPAPCQAPARQDPERGDNAPPLATADELPVTECLPGAQAAEAGLGEQAGGSQPNEHEEAQKGTLHLAGPTDPPNKAVGRLNDRMVSRVDPEAELVTRPGVVADLYYKVHAGVDAGRARIVTAVEVTGGGVTDDQLLERLVLEHEGNVGCQVSEVGADTKYGTVENYRWLQERGIRASIPMVDQTANKQVLPTEAFEYDANTDRFRCPNDQRLTRQGVTTTSAGLALTIYKASPKQCASCPRKEECCGKAKARSISVTDDGGVRDRVAVYLGTFQAKESIRQRKAWIETIFGDGKERRGLRRARCRGLDWMRVQAWMTAIAQNVRQLALRKGKRPESGTGAVEKSSVTSLLWSLFRLPPANAASHHNLTFSLSPN